VRGFSTLSTRTRIGKEDLWFLCAIVMSWLPAPPSDKGGLGAQDNRHLDSGLGKLYNSPERFDMPVPHLDSGLGRLYNLP
jgi:hypothetical protein